MELRYNALSRGSEDWFTVSLFVGSLFDLVVVVLLLVVGCERERERDFEISIEC